jgi:hypothetical protein
MHANISLTPAKGAAAPTKGAIKLQLQRAKSGRPSDRQRNAQQRFTIKTGAQRMAVGSFWLLPFILLVWQGQE